MRKILMDVCLLFALFNARTVIYFYWSRRRPTKGYDIERRKNCVIIYVENVWNGFVNFSLSIGMDMNANRFITRIIQVSM